MGSSGGGAAGYADTARRFAGRSLLAVGSGLAKGVSAVAKGVTALAADSGDKEAVCSLQFALLEWASADGDVNGFAASTHKVGADAQPLPYHRLPVLLVGLDSGFQVWRLDGDNPAELVSRRDGPVKLMEAVVEPRAGEGEALHDELRGERPVLAVVPAPQGAAPLLQPLGGGQQTGHLPAPAAQQQHSMQHSVQLYSLRSHGYVRSLSFGGEVLGVASSGRLLVVALRGQLQAFDACTLQHTFSCLTYTPPTPPPTPAGSTPSARQQRQQHQFVTAGLTSSGSSATSDGPQQQPLPAAGAPAASPAPVVALAPFALGPRWLAYAADTPVPLASSQAVAQRLPSLGRQESHGSVGLESDVSAGTPLGTSPSGRTGVLTSAAVADAARAAASKGGQQLKAGLGAVGSASYRYLSAQYSTWRQGGPQAQQSGLDALEADAAVAGTVVVRDACSRLVVAHFRAHTSPLAALRFSPGGTLLATASVAGHSINLFSIVPPAAAASGLGGGGGSGGLVDVTGGHAVWLYRLYRGMTPAAIRGVSFAPDAAWVAVSSGRGTTHLFHTPAAAPGVRPPEQQGGTGAAAGVAAAGPLAETGVVGRPPGLPAVGRARKPGLLSGGAAGAATAARNLYTGQRAGAAPIAAAFLAAGPGSPTAARTAGDGSSLYVVTQDGLLTRHLLRAPAALDTASGLGAAAASAALGSPGGTASALHTQQQQQQQPDPAGAAPACVLEEADRWDVARHASWPEREEVLVLLPGAASGSGSVGGGEAGPSGGSAGGADAAQQQVWVAQAEAGALSAPGSGSGGTACTVPATRLPLWGDPQFRFFELQVQQLQRQRSAGGAESPPTDGAPSAAFLEHLPARPLHQH